MAQQTINNGDAGLDARTKINTNFLEVYTGKVGTATAQTNVTWTVNSLGLSLNASGYAGTGTALNLTNLTGTLSANSAGISLSMSAGAGGAAPAASANNGSFTFQTVSFSNLNGISFGTSAGSAITASHNALTTARASNDAVGLNTAQTNVTWTVNSAGLSLNAAGYAGTGTSATNASITLDSNGLAISVGAGGAPVAASASNGSFTFQTVAFSNANNVTFGTSAGSIITASVNAAGGLTLSYFNPQDAYVQVAGQQGQGSLHIQPAQFPNVQFDRIAIPIINTNSSNSSGSHTISFWLGIFTRNNSTLSLASSISSSTAVTHSGTAGSYSQYSGIRLFTIGSTNTITEGQYWVGIVSRTTSGGANGTYSQLLASQLNSSYFGLFGVATDATQQYTRGLGGYSATTSGIPNSIAFSEIRGNSTIFLRQPIFYVVSGTV